MHNPFEGIENATLPRQDVYFLPGTYKVRILSVKLTRTRRGENMGVIKTEVLKTDNPQRPVGCHLTQFINFKYASSLDTFGGFAAAGLGFTGTKEETRNAITADLCMQIIGDEQPFAGLVLNVTATNVKTQKNRDFTVHEWSPSDELMAELAA